MNFFLEIQHQTQEQIKQNENQKLVNNIRLMQQNTNNIEIRITEGGYLSKEQIPIESRSVQNYSRPNEETSKSKIQQNKPSATDLFQINDDEKLKPQFFQEPNIESIIQDSASLLEKKLKKSSKKQSEHLKEYMQFFSAFQLKNSESSKQDTQRQEKINDNSQHSNISSQKIRIKTKGEIKKILFQKGIYIQSLSQKLSKKNEKMFQNIQQNNKKEHSNTRIKERKSIQKLLNNKQKMEQSNDSQEIEQDQEEIPKWHYLQQNLTSQYQVHKLFKHMKSYEQFESNGIQQGEKSNNEFQFLQQEYQQPQPQINNHKQFEEKRLNFKVLQIRSTFSPEAFDMICSVGEIYILRISLLINLSDSQIHKHIIYSEGSYGNIYLLNGKINTKKQTQEFIPYQVNQNDTQSYSQFKIINQQQINEQNQTNKDFFVVKCFRLKDNQNLNQLLHSVLKQYCINCIMSALQIGPKVIKKFGFDLMVHQNCIEYCLQFCQNKKSFQQGKSDIQLKTALLTMHQINLVHLDIKPDNIAFSRYFKKWVFLDFGFSDFIRENLGQKSFLCYVGTYEYSSPEMKKALTQDSYVDLYYNDVYALKRSFIFMKKFQEILSGNNSSIYYNNTFSLLLSVEIHHNFVRQALIITRLKYFLLRQDLKKSCFYLKCLLRFANDEKKSQIERVYQIKNTRKKIKKQVEQLFPLLMKQIDSNSIGLPLIKQEQEDWISFQRSNINLESRQFQINEVINQNHENKQDQCKKVKSSKAQIVRFYKSLLLTDFYIDFYYEHINYLIEDSVLHLQIENKIKSNLIHNLVRFQSMQHQDTKVLKKIKSKLFYRDLKSQINQLQVQDQDEDNVNFDKLYALSLSLNQGQYQQSLLAKKSIPQEKQSILYWNQRNKARKGIMHLKQKLLDKKFLDNLSQEQYFNLYYRYVTFKKCIYKAKLSDKLQVSDFFIKYWKINTEKFHNFQQFFQEFINEVELQGFPSNQSIAYSQNDRSNIFQTQKDAQERKKYKKRIIKNLSESNPLYSIIICFRFIIVNCIYIQPFNLQKRQLFTSLICEYFLIDDGILSCENDFNFLVPWCKIIIKHHSFFKNQQQKQQYLRKSDKYGDIQKLKKDAKAHQNFFQLMQSIWRLNQAGRILHYRVKPIKIQYTEAADYKIQIQFILKDRKNLRSHFSSQVAMEKFLKIITVQNFIHYNQPMREFKQFIILEEDLKIIKSEILKNKNTNDRVKINLIKLISLQLFIYDTFIQQTAKISQMISKEKQFIVTQKLFQDIDFKTTLKDQIILLKASQFHYQQNKVISNAKRIILQLASTPFSYKEIEEFHFHLSQRLRLQGKIFQSKSVINLIDKTINCKEISENFLISDRRYYYYYIEKDEKKATDLYQRSVSFLNPYQTFSNVDWLDDLISFSGIFITEQSYRVNQKLKGILSSKQRIQYTENNIKFASYQRFLRIQQIFVDKLKKYIKTVVLSLNHNLQTISRGDYNNFFAIIRQSLFYLKTQPPKSNLNALTSENFFANYETKKSFFYQVFQNALPFCQKYMNQISRNPLVRRFVYCIDDQQKDFKKQFRLVRLEARAIRYFQQRRYLKTINLVYENLQLLGIRPYSKSEPVKQKMEHVRTLLLYVKAFFIQFQLRDHCWFQKYNFPQFVNLKIAYTKQELSEFIKKQSIIVDQSEKKYGIAYKQILKILYLFFVTTGDFLIAMQFNAPSLQFLIETSKNVGDQKSYFQICLYLVSLSRYMSKHSLFKFTTYTIGNIEEFANKNISPITKPLFEYLIKFTENILVHNYQQFSHESKEWKNPHWWIFVNIFLKYSSINSPLAKKILLKIASIMQYLNFRLRHQISQLFYINYLRFKDLQCFKGQITLDKLKNELLKLHKFQLKRNQSRINIYHYLRLRVKSFCGMSPINYHLQSRNDQQTIEAMNGFPVRAKQFIIEDIQSDRIYFLCMRFSGFVRQLNSFYPLTTSFLNSESRKKNLQQQSQNQLSQNEEKPQFSRKKRQNLVRKPSISRSVKEVKQESQKKDKIQSKKQNYSFSVNFNYEFKRKVQEIYSRSNTNQNFIQSQPQISPTKCRIINTIIEKIYIQQKNIENVHFQASIQRSLQQKKTKKSYLIQKSQKILTFEQGNLDEVP